MKRSKLATFAIFLMIFSISAHAFFIPLLNLVGRFAARPLSQGAMWVSTKMIQSGNASRFVKGADLAISSHAIFGYLLWSNSTDPNTEIEIPIQVSIAPKTDQALTNPDPNRFNDAAGGSPSGIQPTAKSTYDPRAATDAAISSFVSSDILSRGENNPTTWRKTSVVNKLWRYQYHITNTPSDPSDAATLTAGWIKGYRGYTTINGASKAVFVEYQEKFTSCDPGYTTGSDGTCTLSTGSQNIAKPAGTIQCEITRTSDSKWVVDPKNPECVSTFAQNITTSSDGKSVTVSDGSSQSVTATDNADGTRDYNFQFGNNWSTVKTGNYDSNTGGRPLVSTTSGTGTNPNGTASGTGGTGGGTGTGTGSGTGSCGGSGQVKCGIDDSGFGEAPSFNDTQSTIDGVVGGVGDKLKNALPAAPSWSFFPSLPSTACAPIVLPSSKFGDVSMNWCPYLDKLKLLASFLAYIATLFGLYRILMRSPNSEQKG
jgi:hypothetical protein